MPSQERRHIKTIFGENVRSARDHLALTQRELGQRLDTDPMNVSRWERGKVMPNLDNLDALARALEVSIEWLVTDHQQAAA